MQQWLLTGINDVAYATDSRAYCDAGFVSVKGAISERIEGRTDTSVYRNKHTRRSKRRALGIMDHDDQRKDDDEQLKDKCGCSARKHYTERLIMNECGLTAMWRA